LRYKVRSPLISLGRLEKEKEKSSLFLRAHAHHLDHDQVKSRVVYQIGIFLVNIGRYFLVFTIPIPKEILVGTFWYHFFGRNPFPLKKGAMAPFLRKKGAPAPFLLQPAPLLRKKGAPAKSEILTRNTYRQVNLIPEK
jgi:hypothetical protein